MNKSYTYRTISQSASSEFKDRGSKFIAYSFRTASLNDVKECLLKIKGEHPKAVHHCYAFRIGSDSNLFRAVDDGEPSGSAGKPILGLIDSFGLTNILIVVVRYFGGTLLGIPGLIQAYKLATQEVLQLSGQLEMNIEKQFMIEFPYPLMNEVMRILKQHQITILKSELKLFCSYHIGIPLIELEITIDQLGKLRELQLIEIDKNQS